MVEQLMIGVVAAAPGSGGFFVQLACGHTVWKSDIWGMKNIVMPRVRRFDLVLQCEECSSRASEASFDAGLLAGSVTGS